MKILFLPLFEMPSGHHRVADAIIDVVMKRTAEIECVKVDLLSYSSRVIEKSVSKLYLKWIHHTPHSYDWAYKHFAYTKSHKHSSFMGLEKFFLYHLKKLLSEEKPDLVICTHGFPSLLMGQLKVGGDVTIPVINAYTDFFMNDIWGRKGIDFHLVPNQDVKKQMIKKHNILERQIIVTGIPVHESFTPGRPKNAGKRGTKRVLMAGGSSGLGNILGFIKETRSDSNIHYIILCGKNKTLFRDIKALNYEHVTALSYISSREEMNQIYNSVDALVTKPGGATVSEAMKKKLPIFVHSALPGQEFVNLHVLKENRLVHELVGNESLENQLVQVFSSDILMKKWEHIMTDYQSQLEMTSMNALFHFIKGNVIEGNHLNRNPDALPKHDSLIGRIKKYAKKIALE